MHVVFADDHTKACVQIPEYPYKENNPEQRHEMAKYYMETIQEEKHLCMKSSGAISR